MGPLSSPSELNTLSIYWGFSASCVKIVAGGRCSKHPLEEPAEPDGLGLVVGDTR